MKFLRTASTTRLLATIVGLVLAIGGGTAIAVAATGGGPVPPRTPLANAIHRGLSAPSVTGITADVTFTNNLIDSSDFTGDNKDPILQGASGRLWLSGDRHLRLELQANNGDTQVVVNGSSFWISDPMSNTVYEGTLPAQKADKRSSAREGVPSIAKIQSELTKVVQHVTLSGAQPTDVAGQAAYRVAVSPKHDGGLLGSAQIAWDAARGVPLEVGIYARGNSTPVLDLKATNIAYGSVNASNFSVSPPSGAKVVKVATPGTSDKAGSSKGGTHGAHGNHGKRSHLSGLARVAAAVPFSLAAPKSLVGLPRHDVSLLSSGGHPAALVTYGQGIGGMAIIEQKADSGATAKSSSKGPSGLSLPTVSINGSTGQELSTALGTVVRFTRGGVAYTLVGSVPAAAAERAARALTP